jgi:hypothetical protein
MRRTNVNSVPSQPQGSHRLDGGVLQMSPFFWFDAGGDSNLEVLWGDGERVSAEHCAMAPTATGTRTSPSARLTETSRDRVRQIRGARVCTSRVTDGLRR